MKGVSARARTRREESALPEAAALRVAAQDWAAACRIPPVDANDSATANANRRLLAAAKRFTAAAERETWDGLCPAGKHGLDYAGQPCDLCRKSVTEREEHVGGRGRYTRHGGK